MVRNLLRGWFGIVNFEEKKEPVRVEDDVDILLKDRPDELKRIQENRSFEKRFVSEPIDDENKNIKVFGKNVDLNAVLKQNIDKRSVFTVDNLCDMFISWRIDQLMKYQKKKRGIDFNWAWLLILILIGVGGMIFVMIYILPRVQGFI